MPISHIQIDRTPFGRSDPCLTVLPGYSPVCPSSFQRGWQHHLPSIYGASSINAGPDNSHGFIAFFFEFKRLLINYQFDPENSIGETLILKII